MTMFYDNYDDFMEKTPEDTLVEVWNCFVEERNDSYYCLILHYNYELEDYFNETYALSTPWQIANEYRTEDLEELEDADYFVDDEIYALQPVHDVAQWINQNVPNRDKWKQFLRDHHYIMDK